MNNLEFHQFTVESLGGPAVMGLLAYVGLGPGPEFIPYFLALLGVVGAALVAALQWPLALLFSLLRRKRHHSDAEEPIASIAAATEQPQSAESHDHS